MLKIVNGKVFLFWGDDGNVVNIIVNGVIEVVDLVNSIRCEWWVNI